METGPTPPAIEAAPPSAELPMDDAPTQVEENPRKRQRGQDDGDQEPVLDNDAAEPSTEDNAAAPAVDGAEDQPKLSKNQLRKLKRQKVWEERRQDRKIQRKEKRHEKTAQNRLRREEKAAALAQAEGIDKAEAIKRVVAQEKKDQKRNKKTYVVPVSFIIDCDFEKYMHENEIVSLGAQITRSYSMNRQGDYQAHILVSSWGGKLKERYETVLKNAHKNWKGVSFVDGDFVEAGKVAWNIMHGPRGGKPCPTLGGDVQDEQQQSDDVAAADVEQQAQDDAPESGQETALSDKPVPEFTTDSVIYLSADSPHTLEKLEPNTSYVIGGLVDRNREKLLCQRRAEGKNIRTAKLPIGDYMQMASRQVLATNHVVEIMSKWLETGDWGKAFMEVIPKRKGGRLKGEDGDEDHDEDHDEAADADADDQNIELGNEDGEKQGDFTANPEA
ncbi:tRNA (guanine(9)-N1)-methyltransferase [Cytospora mali]|uniref:tRNA (guanine(9)-N1)-methyltransferase n=1 Tax=Cytospora mali TaxID=578113 RepID=A0A194UX93_CYTMA|nr:tRNA (guanine(9)-N1)-methyltransferase [Valsa mali var. pyri (nom. inval.)]